MQIHTSLSDLLTGTLASLRPRERLQLVGLHEGQKVWLASGLAHTFLNQAKEARLVLVFSDAKRLREWADLLRCNGQWERDVQTVQALTLWGVQRHSNQSEIRHRRLQMLCQLRAKNQGLRLCLLSFAGLMQETLHPQLLDSTLFHLEKGKEYDLDALLAHLHELGYRQVSQVEEIGQYAVRGGLLDVFSPATDGPMRLEFMADLLVGMRCFARETQISLFDCEDFFIAPVWEGSLPMEQRKADAQKLYEALLEQNLPSADRQGLIDAFAAGHAGQEIPMFLPLFRQDSEVCLLDYLSENDQLVFVDPLETCLERYEQFLQKASADWKEDLVARHPSLAPERHFLSVHRILEKLSAGPIQMEWANPFDRPGFTQHALTSLLPIDLTPPPQAEKASINFWMERFASLPHGTQKVLILVRQEEHLLRVRSVLQHHQLPFHHIVGSAITPWLTHHLWTEPLAIAIGNIPQMVWEDSQELLILPEHQLFSETFQTVRHNRKAAVDAFKSFNDIEPGSLVVHIDHGIGRFAGMRTMEVGGIRTDFLILEYLDQDRLYLPVHRLNLLQRYASKLDEDLQPPLDKLQSSGWQKRKAKASRAIQDMAEQLLRLYAQRKLERREPFSPPSDTYYQFEADFPYIETPGQQQAIDDVNADLSSEQPMDRLVCVDVGYGKTEVALRAAVRVALDGGQVMLLAPTTLLSYQHYETFRARCRPYGIEVGVANRPRSLHMSLLGIRDISVITTAPTERLAIRTFVASFDGELIKKAIEHELQRGGQVFFVHNRVQDIGSVKEFLQDLMPGVSIAIAHGQMRENNVESVIIDFIQQKYSVLLCTTIIESGIDMPNVNTIIINNADNFGLSQLYQMRGRVGRSSRQSYAYFLSRGRLADRDDARRRLEILASHQELGVGFQIASYDMELRGTGNLLGGEQSGHIADVGFDMYMELLEKEIQILQGLEPETQVDPEIKIPVSAALSEHYIKEEKQRILIYKSLFSSRDLAEVQRLVSEVRDRFGAPPLEAQMLFQVATLKVILRSLKVQQLQKLPSGMFELRFSQLKEQQIMRVSEACSRRPEVLQLTADFRLIVQLKERKEMVSLLQSLIEAILPLILDP
ncbi:MAG: helicase-related protein [Proteobacteria bacterium]|nr:helicase-related protein [Pseudomonadota bacterium]